MSSLLTGTNNIAAEAWVKLENYANVLTIIVDYNFVKKINMILR